MLNRWTSFYRYKSSGQEFDKSKGAQFADAEGSLLLAESQADLYQRKFDAACSTISRLKTRYRGTLQLVMPILFP
jgi:hypothetical protein